MSSVPGTPDLRLRHLALALGLAVGASVASAQTWDARSMMWPAPTAEDWARPCLITWQRTYEDALAVSRETGRPILVCVNMDGEIASEHYAGVRYRQPEIAALYEPYVTVIASVYRHTPRDHDEQGRRILCPRFGSVTCGEHIAIEPGLFETFFDDRRIAPRHIGVELDGQEMYDVLLAPDTASVFAVIREGITTRPEIALPPARGDRPLVERVTSPDIRDRIEVETTFDQGDRVQRIALMEAAAAASGAAPLELLRLAVLGADVELARMARRALARSESEGAIDLIERVLREPLAETEREELIAALARLGESFPRAERLAIVHRGLSGDSGAVDVEAWFAALPPSGSLSDAPLPMIDPDEMAAQLEKQDSVLASDDPDAHLELAGAFMAFAWQRPASEKEYADPLFRDARNIALAAGRLGARGWRLHAAVAVPAYYLGKKAEAYTRAVKAVERSGLERVAPDAADEWQAMAVLAIFAQARQEAIRAAVREKREWPAVWLTDIHAACVVLARHPHGTEEQVVQHHDFLKSLGAPGHAAHALEEGLARFPDSWDLHERMRQHLLVERGFDGLEAAYEAMLHRKDAAEVLDWYAGQASLVAAEFHRRAGQDARALAAYERAIAHWEQSIPDDATPEQRADADHQVALALAGRARLAYEAGDDERALAELLSSFVRHPEAAGTLDGLNISAADTARMLHARLVSTGKQVLLERLEATLGQLDPELLKLPAYEAVGKPQPDP